MRLALIVAAALAGAAAPALAQFGQNHVITRDFQWKVRSTEHFDVHYYEDSGPLVQTAAEVLEKAFEDVARRLDIPTEPPVWVSERERKKLEWRKRPFFLYASPNDFRQSNIARPGDGTGGITEPFKDRFMVYHDGSKQWLEEVTTHEFVHIMQFHVLITGFWRSGRILKTIVYPLWMMEGMPGYLTYGIESALEETTLRDAATSGGLLPLVRIERFGHLKPHQVSLAYKQGSAAMAFLAEQFGERKVGDMLRLFESRLESGQVLTELIGLDAFEFDKKYREWLENRYRRAVRVAKLREPSAFGGALTKRPDNIPQFNSSPVFSPDGRTMYFVSTGEPYPPRLESIDLRTGRRRKLAGLPYAAVETLPLGHFANLSRVLDISPDGRRLAFAGTKNHADAIYLYDIARRKLERRRPPGFQTISQPRFSPDGRSLVFSGMRRTFTDIYLYDLKSGAVRALTDDSRDDQTPAFTPDGRSVVYSAEVSDPLGTQGRERRLYRVDLGSQELTRLEESGGEARDPVVSRDGRSVLFAHEKDGTSELCELSLESGRVARLTRSVGGSFAPVYAPDGELAFAALRRGDVHIHKGARGDFLDETVAPVRRERSDEQKFMLPGMGAIAVSSGPKVGLGPERDYRFQYSTDLFIPAFFYSSEAGFFWTSYWQGSDMLGNHQNSALVSIHSGASYDYSLRYGYSRWRPQLIAGADGFANKGLVDIDTRRGFDDSVHSQFVGVAYPLDRYHRLELIARSVSESLVDTTADTVSDRQARLLSAAAVRDTTRGRYLVVTQGNRLRASYSQAVDALGANRRYDLATVEAHQFFQTGSQAALAFKAEAAQSVGPQHPQFLLGGLGGVRGVGRSTLRDFGNRLVVATAEWRFPLAADLNYHMWYFFPDFYFKAIFGTLFTDAGYAWDSEGQLARARWRELRHSVGAGIRIYTFILQEFPFVLAMDYAHRTTQNGGIFYVYLGQLF